MKSNSQLITIPALLMALLTMGSCVYNWPQFRGPESNMVARARNLPDMWDQETHIRWTAEMEGESWSSPVVWGNKVFVTYSIPVKVTPPPESQVPPPPPTSGNPPAGGRGQAPPPSAQPQEDTSYLSDIYRWEVLCLDLNTGETIWRQVALEGSPRTKKNRASNYASETPVTDGQRLYVYFGMNGVFCFDLEGELIWEKDLGAFRTQNGWGTGSSPLIYQDKLYIQVDNEENSFLVALDASTGDEVWKVKRDEKTNYSTPVIWKNSVRTELVAGGKTARSYDPATGEIYWELAVGGYYNIPSSVFDRDHLYLGNTAFRNTPGSLFCIRAGAEGNITPAEDETTSSGVVWSDMDASTANPSLLLYEGLLYQVSSRGGEITCIDAATGEQVYQEKIEGVGACWASPWAHRDKVFFIDEKGVTRVFRAGETFELLHENTLDDKFWSSVAVSRDAYILKGVDKLYCIGL